MLPWLGIPSTARLAGARSLRAGLRLPCTSNKPCEGQMLDPTIAPPTSHAASDGPSVRSYHAVAWTFTGPSVARRLPTARKGLTPMKG